MSATLSGTRVRRIDHFAVAFMALINNAPYEIGIASAQKIVSDFGVPGYLGIVHWADTVSGVFARFLNSWLISLRVSYPVLFGVNLVMLLLGLLACAFAKKVFVVECFGIFLIGFASSMGEAIVLCYMSRRRKEVLLKSWGVGTGMSGITGSSYALFVAYYGVSNFWSFIGVSPLVFVYGLLFYGVLVHSPNEDTMPESELVSTPVEEQKLRYFDCSYIGANWWYMINCGMVYFFEYAIQGVFANCALTHDDMTGRKWFFPLLNLFYRVGALFSRSSLTLFTFRRVGLLTLCQAFMFCFWQCQAVFHFMPLWGLCCAMIVVGLFGGCSYVNAFNLIMTNWKLNNAQREMVVGHNATVVSIFIVLATVFTFVSEMTFMSPYVPE